MTLHYINEQTTNLADLVSKINTWCTTTLGWNADRHVPASGEWAISKAAEGTNTDDIQVAFRWDTSGPNRLAVYQYNHASGAGNYNAANTPGNQSNDSGNGMDTGTDGTSTGQIGDGRHVTISDSPIQYWGFAQTGVGLEQYVYIVIETSTDVYTHFGFGELVKFNDWVGGAFAYGSRVQGVFTTGGHNQPGTSVLLDGYAQNGTSGNPNDMRQWCATIHSEGLSGQAGNSEWGVCGGGGLTQTGSTTTDLGDDRAGNDRMHWVGGYRANQIARSWGWSPGSPAAGFVPSYPIMVWYRDRYVNTTEIWGPMGVMPNVQGVMLENYAPEDEVTIGSQVWKLFPTRKRTTANEASGTRFQGMMYRKS